MVPCIPMGSAEGGRRTRTDALMPGQAPDAPLLPRRHFPNIRETSLADALRDSYYMGFIDTRLRDCFAHNPGCAVCEYRNRCAGGCRGRVAGRREDATSTSCRPADTSVSVRVAEDDLLARDEDACAFFRQGWYNKVTRLKEKILPKDS